MLSYDFYKRTLAVVEKIASKALLHELALEQRKHTDIPREQVVEITF